MIPVSSTKLLAKPLRRVLACTQASAYTYTYTCVRYKPKAVNRRAHTALIARLRFRSTKLIMASPGSWILITNGPVDATYNIDGYVLDGSAIWPVIISDPIITRFIIAGPDRGRSDGKKHFSGASTGVDDRAKSRHQLVRYNSPLRKMPCSSEKRSAFDSDYLTYCSQISSEYSEAPICHLRRGGIGWQVFG